MLFLQHLSRMCFLICLHTQIRGLERFIAVNINHYKRHQNTGIRLQFKKISRESRPPNPRGGRERSAPTPSAAFGRTLGRKNIPFTPLWALQFFRQVWEYMIYFYESRVLKLVRLCNAAQYLKRKGQTTKKKSAKSKRLTSATNGKISRTRTKGAKFNTSNNTNNNDNNDHADCEDVCPCCILPLRQEKRQLECDICMQTYRQKFTAKIDKILSKYSATLTLPDESVICK